MQHSHREHSGRGKAGGGVLQDEERECGTASGLLGFSLLRWLPRRHPLPLPSSCSPITGVLASWPEAKNLLESAFLAAPEAGGPAPGP